MTVIVEGPDLGGQAYPFLTGYDWQITSTKLDGEEAVAALLKPRKEIKLRGVKQDKVIDIEGSSPLLTKLHVGRASFVTSKRLSRLMRPFYFWEFPDTLDVVYHPEWNRKTWDGAGRIRRDVLLKLCHHLPVQYKAMLTQRLMRAGRIELTLQTSRGQDKGHCIVVDEMEHEIELPCDTKTEVTFDGIFLGVAPIQAHPYMTIDIQSVINLHPFLDAEHYRDWLREESDLYLSSIRTGEYAKMIERLDHDNLEVTALFEYLKCGGNALWFRGIVRAIGNQYVKHVVNSVLGRVHLPIPGGRFYIMVDEVGDKVVAPGYVKLDAEHATAWVSDQDWPSISAKLGGADQDDSVPALPFHDYDGELKVLLWRNPNQKGEWVILKPTDLTVEECAWAQWPDLDSRKLPQAQQHTYLDLVPKAKASNRPYSVEAMSECILAAYNNAGAIGQTVNLQMVEQAMSGCISDEQPASLEQIIDGQAKTGADLSAVKEWNVARANEHFGKFPIVAESLVKRLWKIMDTPEALVHTRDHWLEHLLDDVEVELKRFNMELRVIEAQCMPPMEVFTYGQDSLGPAGDLRQIYGFAIASYHESEEAFEVARTNCEAYLWTQPLDQWTRILAGVVVRAYAMDESSSDACIWQAGAKTEEGRKRGIAHVALKMCREVGIIREWGAPTQPYAGMGVPLKINGPWFALYRARLEAKKLRLPETMGDVPKAERDAIKAEVAQWARAGEFNKRLTIVRSADRATVWREGHLLGYVQKGQEGRIGEMFDPIFSLGNDGNLLMIVKEADHV